MYTSQRKAPEQKASYKGLIIATAILCAFTSIFCFGWAACYSWYQWKDERLNCLEQAAKIEQAWCDDNNNLIK